MAWDGVFAGNGYEPKARWSRATLPLLSNSTLPYLSARSFHHHALPLSSLASSADSPLDALEVACLRLVLETLLCLDVPTPLSNEGVFLTDVESYLLFLAPALSFPIMGVISSAELSACCCCCCDRVMGDTDRDIGLSGVENWMLRVLGRAVFERFCGGTVDGDGCSEEEEDRLGVGMLKRVDLHTFRRVD